MIAIQANEQGHPVVIESFERDGKRSFREVDAERWAEIVGEEIDLSATPQAIIPVTVATIEICRGIGPKP